MCKTEVGYRCLVPLLLHRRNGYIENNPLYGRSSTSSKSTSETTLTSPSSTSLLFSPITSSSKKKFEFSFLLFCQAFSTSSVNTNPKSSSFKSFYEPTVLPLLSSKLRLPLTQAQTPLRIFVLTATTTASSLMTLEPPSATIIKLEKSAPVALRGK